MSKPRDSRFDIAGLVVTACVFFTLVFSYGFFGVDLLKTPNSTLLFVSLICLLAGIFLFVFGLIAFRRKRLIENIPLSKVRSLAMGLVEISGQAVPGDNVLKAPFSGRDCIYYRYRLQQYLPDGRILASETWNEKRTNFFHLKDDTGSVLVNVKGAKFQISNGYTFDSRTDKNPPPNVYHMMRDSGMKGKGGGDTIYKDIRFTEWIIAPGDNLYVMGAAGDNPFRAEATAQHSREDVMIHKGSDERFFFISDRKEMEIVGKLLQKSLGFICGGIALIAGGLAFISFFFGVF